MQEQSPSLPQDHHHHHHQLQQQQDLPQQQVPHSHESGGLVWQIVEQEMVRKGGPDQGRDRGVGRTVKVLQDRLPGIRIFKRDVYNIRAQIKRARKQAGEEVGDGVGVLGDENGHAHGHGHGHGHLLGGLAGGGAGAVGEGGAGAGVGMGVGVGVGAGAGRDEGAAGNRFPEIDPLLVAQCNDALRHVGAAGGAQGGEAERLRRENEELKVELARRIKDAEEKAIENQRLKVELEMVKLEAMYNRQGAP